MKPLSSFRSCWPTFTHKKVLLNGYRILGRGGPGSTPSFVLYDDNKLGCVERYRIYVLQYRPNLTITLPNRIIEAKVKTVVQRVIILRVRVWNTVNTNTPGIYEANTRALPSERGAWHHIFATQIRQWVRGMLIETDQSPDYHGKAIVDTRGHTTTGDFHCHPRIDSTDQFY